MNQVSDSNQSFATANPFAPLADLLERNNSNEERRPADIFDHSHTDSLPKIFTPVESRDSNRAGESDSRASLTMSTIHKVAAFTLAAGFVVYAVSITSETAEVTESEPAITRGEVIAHAAPPLAVSIVQFAFSTLPFIAIGALHERNIRPVLIPPTAILASQALMSPMAVEAMVAEEQKKLWEASRRGNVDEVKALIKMGAVDINAQDSNGWTALHYAIHYGYGGSIGTILVENGAELDIKTNYNWAMSCLTNYQGKKPLELASTEKLRAQLKQAKKNRDNKLKQEMRNAQFKKTDDNRKKQKKAAEEKKFKAYALEEARIARLQKPTDDIANLLFSAIESQDEQMVLKLLLKYELLDGTIVDARGWLPLDAALHAYNEYESAASLEILSSIMKYTNICLVPQ